MKIEQGKLKTDLGFSASLALVVGMVIGSGIFMKPGKVIEASGDSTSALMVWVIGGIITMAAGLTIAELAAQIPKTGGLYVYLNEAYGKLVGYFFGWVNTLIYGPATMGALGLYFASLLIPFLGINEALKVPIAICTVILLAGINSLGAKYGGFIQTVATVGKMLPIILIAVLGMIKGNSQVLGMSSGITQEAGVGAALLSTLWAYDGWIAVSFVAGEMKNPGKYLPRAIILGLCVVMTAYIGVNIALMHVLPAAEVASLGKYAAGTAAGILLGDLGGKLVSIGILVSIFGALNGYTLTSSRIPYAMAVDGQLPLSCWFAKVHPTFGTPIYAMALQVVIAIGLMTMGDPDRLTDVAMFVMCLFYIFGFIAVFIMRRKNQTTKRSYSVPLYPIVPLVAIAGAGYIVISTIITNLQDPLYALVIMLAGLPSYWYLNRK